MWRWLLGFLVVAVLVAAGAFGTMWLAERSFGPASASLGPLMRLQYSAKVLWADGLLTRPLFPEAPEIRFEVQPGESVISVCNRLESEGVVASGALLRDYLIYTGMDTSLQAGKYRVSASMSMIELARVMQDATPAEVDFVVLPGWRLEEIGAGLPASGLSITPEEFVQAATAPRAGFDFLEGAATAEGFLYPDTYVVGRATGAEALLDLLVGSFAAHLDTQLRDGFARQGLSVYEAVTVASIVEREAVHAEEAPLIASVYLNRLRAGMRLDADPTVQYALGYNEAQQTWWTNPLSLDDLKVASPYNTYQVDGLPPSPIANPGADALQAVAAPAESAMYFFSARCDASGYHNFAATFEEHLTNLCP